MTAERTHGANVPISGGLLVSSSRGPAALRARRRQPGRVCGHVADELHSATAGRAVERRLSLGGGRGALLERLHHERLRARVAEALAHDNRLDAILSHSPASA